LRNLLTGLIQQPYALLFLLLGIGIANLWHRRRESIRRLLLVTLPFVVLTVLSIPAIAHLSTGTLEWRYPPTEQRPDAAEAIVVLGGGVHPADATRLRAEMNSATLVRCLHAAAVYHQGKPCPVVVSGGSADPGTTTPPVALLMRDFLHDQGLNVADLIVEDRSRSTHENAVECRKVLEQRRISKVILVTDATHMFRALRSFRKQGIEAVPSACAHRATQFEWGVFDFLPSANAVQNHERTFHEWLGFAWYWFRGYL
jgi:uncharacterized SAM-binding protein YcdF (DUF218 family)